MREVVLNVHLVALLGKDVTLIVTTRYKLLLYALHVLLE